MFPSKALLIILHLTGWLLFFSLVAGFVSMSPEGNINVWKQLVSVNHLVFYGVYIFLFYFNGTFLIPKLYLQKKYVAYFLMAGLLLVAVYFLHPFDSIFHAARPFREFHRPPEPEWPMRQSPRRSRFDIVSIVLFLMIWSLSTALQIIRQWRLTEQRAVQAEAEKATAELSFLKAQINPHFLFNTLNNIYALAVAKSEHTAASIMKLSNIMRYVTDEATRNFVPLNSELDCISYYIDLQRLRLNKKTEVDYSVTGNLEKKQIAPLILMTFVENVFKYGVSNHEPSTISIKLVSEEQSVSFFCRNKIFQTHNKAERPGIGIANTKQRLEHLYPDKHTLHIAEENGWYVVQLTLQR
jgi:hypothetical protein